MYRMLFCAVLLLLPEAALARSQAWLVGSSTVYPFARLVAEAMPMDGPLRPIVQSTGSGAGIKALCQGQGSSTPDIAAASRAMTDAERDLCAINGAGPIIEVQIGRDGIVLAELVESPPFALTLRQLFRAVAAALPAYGTWVPNPHRRWQDVDPSLPSLPIRVYGPTPGSSGTWDAFEDLVMIPGCAALARQPGSGLASCTAPRQDGGFIAAGEDDAMIVKVLERQPQALGLFGFSLLDTNRDRLRGVPLNGVAPSFETIADGTYPLARPLRLYIKAAHLNTVAGLRAYVEAFLSERSVGVEGILTDAGLIPLAPDSRDAMRARVR